MSGPLVILPRYFVRINGETVDQGQSRKSFSTEQAAAEFAWSDIRRGAQVETYNDMSQRRTRWTWDAVLCGIVGDEVRA